MNRYKSDAIVTQSPTWWWLLFWCAKITRRRQKELWAYSSQPWLITVDSTTPIRNVYSYCAVRILIFVLVHSLLLMGIRLVKYLVVIQFLRLICVVLHKVTLSWKRKHQEEIFLIDSYGSQRRFDLLTRYGVRYYGHLLLWNQTTLNIRCNNQPYFALRG